MNQNQLVMTNGRLDNSKTDILDLYTRKRMTKSGEQRTLIDYILVNHGQYRHCVSHENVWRHNGTRKVKTDHCLSILTTQNTICANVTIEKHQARTTGTRRHNIRRIFNKYIIFTDEEVRKEYQRVCKISMSEWK